MSGEVGAEAGDGEEPGEGGQPSVELLNGERKTTDDHSHIRVQDWINIQIILKYTTIMRITV